MRTIRTQLLLTLFLAATHMAMASQSAVLTPGNGRGSNLPDSGSFTLAAESATSTRWEFRVHNWTAPAGGAYWQKAIWSAWSIFCDINETSSLSCVDFFDTTDGADFSISVSGLSDFVAILNRDASAKKLTLVLCDIGLTSCSSRSSSILTLGSGGRIAGMGIGADNTSASLAWLRWRTGTSSVGPRDYDAVADLADYEFEGNFTDVSANANAMSVVSGSALSFVTTPQYNPSCVPGPVQVFRAGHSGSLDGSGSVPLNGLSTLTYAWRQVSGPTGVAFTNTATALTQVSGMVFGTYVFGLTVTDSSGVASNCTVKDGAVATDDNGFVNTGNPNVDKILGPLTRWGVNPWSYYDERMKAWADKFGKAQGTPAIQNTWDVALSGTVSITAGTSTITGVGTHFQADFCGGTTTGNSTQLIFWYQIPSSSEFGRFPAAVTSCASDTGATINFNLPTGDGIGTFSGIQYSRMSNADVAAWINGSTNANYYDNVLAFYTLYYRSGIDTYLNYAHWLADTWWTLPWINKGHNCSLDGFLPCLFPRIKSYTGLMLRALERGDRWPGMEAMLTLPINTLQTADNSLIGDIREESYNLGAVALCAVFDPNALASICKSALASSISNRWGTQKFPDGSWKSFVAQNWVAWGGSVNVTNGSTSVVGVGTTFDSTITGQQFWTSSTNYWIPANTDGDHSYIATYVDATHITLDHAYTGPNGTGRSYMTAANVDGAWIGYGDQPFMVGVLATNLFYSYEALNGYDAPSSAIVRQGVIDAGTWIVNNGVQASPNKGLWYGVGFGRCNTPTQSTDVSCVTGSAEGDRELAPEVFRGMTFAYQLSGSSAIKNSADALYAANFAAFPSDTLYDGTYDIAVSENGFMWGSNAAKWFGFFWGFGGGSTWPASRIGGELPSQNRTVLVSFHLPTGATSADVVVTRPHAVISVMNCTAACSITVDDSLGKARVQLRYKSSGGVVTDTTQPTDIN